MPETRHELAIGESIVIDDYLLTVEDIRGEDVVFRIEPLPAGHFPQQETLTADAEWRLDAGLNPTDGFSGETLVEVPLEETEPNVRGTSLRSRPR
jgi:hypothetical protein